MTRRYKVKITDFIFGDLAPEREVLGDLADVEALYASNEEQLFGRVEDADVLIVYHDISLSRQTIERLGNCRLIVRGGVGYDNVDCAYARQRGISVANVPHYGTEDVADTAIGFILALTRGIAFLNRRLQAGLGPWSYMQAVPLRRLRGRVLGIVGLGRIGTATALRAKACNFDVVFYDPYLPDGCDKALGIRRCENLDELLAESSVISLHCPLTEETRRLIDAAALKKLPYGSYLVNTARGALVDSEALLAALTMGHLAGAGIDVLELEPPPADDPLIRSWRDPSHPAHQRLLINPHSAFYCEEGLAEVRRKAAEVCRRALHGLPLRTLVNGTELRLKARSAYVKGSKAAKKSNRRRSTSERGSRSNGAVLKLGAATL